jgi:hypothetical protein
MRTPILTGIILTATLTLAAAEPKEAVKAAAQALAGKPNYSWVTSVELPGSPFTPGPMKGKTEKDGYTLLAQEMQDNTLEAVQKGDKGAAKLPDGWKTAEELTTPPPKPGEQPNFDPAVMFARFLLNTKRPTVEVEQLLGQVKELKAGDGGQLAGELNDEGATDLLRFGPKPRPGADGKLPPGPPPPKNAKGDVKFFLKDGALVRYVVHAKGVVTFGGNETDFERIATVEIKDVGTTKVETPEAAKQKLTP